MESQRKICPACGATVRLAARYCGQCGYALDTVTHAPAAQAMRPVPTDEVFFVPGRVLAGRYRLVRFLGAGGFGETYLAQDLKFTERLCVVKRQRTRTARDEAERAYFSEVYRHEGNLLAGLNEPGHPNIPAVFDILPEDRCLVMKYIAGKDLRTVLAEHDGPLDGATALRYARDLCSALDYMHRRDTPVLHRDVKPANILIDSTGRILLIDFGLAVPDSTPTGGTPGYAPLEQWAGAAEPRSDVFALGITLYQMLSGIKAFNEATIKAITQGRTEVLPLVSHFNPAVDAAVATLIQRCIAGKPGDRPDAAMLLEALEHLISRPVIPPAFKPDALPNTPQFVGRADELRDLQQRLERDHLLALTGLPGVGKTALAANLAWRAGPPERVFWHRLAPGEGAERLLRTLSAFLAYYGETTLVRLLTQTADDLALRSAFGSAALVSELVSFERRCDVLVAGLRGRGLMLAIDDAHVDDHDPQLALLCQRLLALVQSREISLIIAAREPPAWMDEHDCTVIDELIESDAAELLLSRDLNLGQDEVRQIYAATSGNAEQLHLVANSLHAPHTKAQPLEQLLASGDLQNYLIRQIYDLLSPEQRQVMSVVAILGDGGATRDAVEALTGLADCQALLRELTRRYLLASSGTHTDAVLYTAQPSYARMFLQQLDERRTETLHEQAAHYLLSQGQQPLRAARHLLAAGGLAAAAQVVVAERQAIINAGQGEALAALLDQINPEGLELRVWAELCTVQSEVAALHGRYRAALKWIEQTSGLEAEVGTGLAEADVLIARRCRLQAFYNQRIGAYQAAEQICRDALRDVARLPARHAERARLHIELATALWRQGSLAEALQACDAGLKAVPVGPSGDRERLLLWYVQAAVAIDQGQPDEALVELDHGVERATAIGDKALLAMMYEKSGLAHYRKRSYADASRAYHQSLNLRRSLGDVAGEIAALNDLATVDWAQGQWEPARQHFSSLSERCHGLGLRGHEATARLNLGQMLLEYDQTDDAATQLTKALRAYRQVGDDLGIAHCSYLLGDVALLQGNPERAYDLGTSALEATPIDTNPVYAACALRVMGAACLALGRLTEADALLAQARLLHDDLDEGYDLAWVLASWAEVASAQAQPEIAVERARMALALAEEQQIGPVRTRMVDLLERLERERGGNFD